MEQIQTKTFCKENKIDPNLLEGWEIYFVKEYFLTIFMSVEYEQFIVFDMLASTIYSNNFALPGEKIYYDFLVNHGYLKIVDFDVYLEAYPEVKELYREWQDATDF